MSALVDTPARYLKAAADGHLGYEIQGDCEAGFRAFFEATVDVDTLSREGRFGFYRGMAVAYAQGVLEHERYRQDNDNGTATEPSNPYPQFTPAWEAWAEGCDDHAAAALERP